MIFRGNNTLELSMVFQGLVQQEAEKTWAPFLDWMRADSSYSFSNEVRVLSLPARHQWDADFMRKNAPGFTVADARPEALDKHFLWPGDQGQVGQFLYGFQSAWLPDNLLEENRQSDLAEALFASSRQWQISLHFNKGLAGAPPKEIAAAKNTAMNPGVLNAFALAICLLGGWQSAEPDPADAPTVGSRDGERNRHGDDGFQRWRDFLRLRQRPPERPFRLSL